MPKDKKPRRKKTPREETTPAAEEPTQLVPAPAREPTTTRTSVPDVRPLLFLLIDTVRGAVGALLDLADATAEAINKQLERRPGEAGE